MPIVPETRVTALQEVLGAFYFGAFSIVGAFMGFSVWMDKKK
jgi:hypothetical protein